MNNKYVQLPLFPKENIANSSADQPFVRNCDKYFESSSRGTTAPQQNHDIRKISTIR